MALPVFPSDSLGAADPATGAPLPLSAAAVALLSSSLPDACTNTRHVYEDDGAGGQTQTDLPLGPWACRMLKEPKPLDKVLAGGVVQTIPSRELEVELGADIKTGDDLQHGGNEWVVLVCDFSTTGATFGTVFLEGLGHLSAS